MSQEISILTAELRHHLPGQEEFLYMLELATARNTKMRRPLSFADMLNVYTSQNDHNAVEKHPFFAQC